jgi:hypothetical protein
VHERIPFQVANARSRDGLTTILAAAAGFHLRAEAAIKSSRRVAGRAHIKLTSLRADRIVWPFGATNNDKYILTNDKNLK